MVITTTGIAFILLSLGVAFCGWQFFFAFKKAGGAIDNKTGLLISIFFFLSALQNGVLGIGALLFPDSPRTLYSFLLLSHFSLALMTVSSIALFYYVVLPNRSPRMGIGTTISLGLLFIFYTISTDPQPFLTSQNGIDWGMNSLLSLLMFSLFFLSLLPPTYIFFKLFLVASNKKLKRSAILISGLCFAGIINVFMRLVIFNSGPFGLRTRILDIAVATIGIGFIIPIAVLPFLQGLKFNFKKSSFKNLDI